MNADSDEKKLFESDERHSREWLNDLMDGKEAVVGEFWNQYGNRLEKLADRQLNAKLNRRIEANDVVQSACRTFFRRAEAGQFHLEESESLWRLLCAIVVNKARMKIRFHLQAKRTVGNEEDLSSNEESPRDLAVSKSPTPDALAEFNDQFEFIMQSLDDEEAKIIQLKLEDLNNDEIATRIGCSERTVRRIFARIRARLIEQWETE